MIAESQDNAEEFSVDDSLRRVYRELADGIEAIGGIAVAAGVCGTDRSDLRKALDRNGRRIALDHAIAIAARVRKFNAEIATKIGSALVEPLELCVFPRVTLTAEEKAARLEALVLRMPLGEQLLADALGRTR